MSRNYDILRQTEKDKGLFTPPSTQLVPRPSSPPLNGNPPTLGIVGQGKEEIVKLVQRIFRAPGTLVPRTDVLGATVWVATAPGATASGATAQGATAQGATAPPKVVVFSGVEPGSGSSSLCAQSAEVLAAQGSGAVCLVDANLRTPSLHRWFGMSQEDGLTEAVFHPGPIQKYLRRVNGAASPFLLTAGSAGSEDCFFLNAERLQSRLMEMRMEFAYILIDVPPVNSYADAQVVGALADGLVLVIEANVTRRESARKAKEILKSAGVNLLGAVLNNRTYPIPERWYQRF